MTHDRFGVFGWNGISFEVPSAWELGRETGSRRDGYCRLDDEFLPRLELTWKKPDKKHNVDRLSDNYIANLRKRFKKQDPEVQKLIGFTEVRPDKDVRMFKWGHPHPVYEMVAFCRHCYRLSFMRYISEKDSGPVERAKRMFASFQDHAEDGRELWAFLGLRLTIPGNYSLDKTILNAGFIRLDFSDRDDGLAVLMISMGREHLEKHDLEGLARHFLARDLRRFPQVVFAPMTVNGHEGVKAGPGGKPRGSWFFRPLFPEKGTVRIFAWLCEQTNKIFIVKAYSLKHDKIEALTSEHKNVSCH
ncbi:hypothetical protein ACFL4W_00820 [Planctomycetota bacterium]